MTPEEKFNKIAFQILKKIKEYQLFYVGTNWEILYSFDVKSPKQCYLDNETPRDVAIEEEMVIYKLQELNIITEFRFDKFWDSYFLKVDQAKFDYIYDLLKSNKGYIDHENGKLTVKEVHTNKNNIKEVKLISGKVHFIDEKATIEIQEVKIKLPPNKNEYCLCKVMFNKEVDVPIDWSNVFEEMTGKDFTEGNTETNKRCVYDTYLAINSRLKEELNTDQELFTWKGKTITRNY